MQEIDKYTQLYDLQFVCGQNRGYGHTLHAKFCPNLIDDIKEIKPDLVIDCGTGHGEFCKFIADNFGISIVGIDFASMRQLPLHKLISQTPLISFMKADIIDDCVFDNIKQELQLSKDARILITSFDVLEHLEEFNIENIFKSWSNHTSYVLGTISHGKSRCKIGNEYIQLHPTVKSRQWWAEKMSAYFPCCELTSTTSKKSSEADSYYVSKNR